MKNMPKISIIMGIFNCELYLEESINSIINQTYSNWELVMCDDGSQDKTLKIAKKFEKKYPDKIKVLENDKNMGLNYTLNKCIKYTTGEFIARQDGDDISLPNRFEKEMEFLINNPQYDLVSCNMIFFDENGDWGESHNFGEVTKENFIQGSPICHAPCIIRRNALEDVDGYSVAKKLLRVEDYHLWFKLFIKGYKCYNLKECLYKMRDDENAYKRRNFRNRLNETKLKLWGFSKIGIPLKDYIWAFKPLVAYFMPQKLYQKYHRKKLINTSKNKKIKIAEFVSSMNLGGTETMLINILKNLNPNKFEIVFIENVIEKSYYTDEIEKLGGRIIKIKPYSFKNIFSYLKELKEILKSENFDVVHSHTYLHSGLVMYAAKKANIPIRISHSHSAMGYSDNGLLKTKFLRFLLNKYSTKKIACSTDAGISLFGNCFKKEGIVIHNPIDVNKYLTVNNDMVEKLYEKYNLNKDYLIIGNVGRLVEVKNHKFMIELAKKLKENNYKFKIFFLGDGILKETIKKEIENNNLKENIILTGNVNNVNEYMKFFDLLLLPSFYEGFPLVLIEAQASGLYSLISNKISKEVDLGLKLIKFLDINNIDAWVDEIKNFKKSTISNEKIKKVLVEKNFDVSKTILEFEKIYK